MSVIDTVYAAGDDALQYEWQVTFGTIPYLDTTTDFNVRCSNVDIPTASVGTYTVDWKSENFNKPNGKVTTPKQFSITFRVDKAWKVYQAFLGWNHAIVNPSTGGTAIDSNLGISTIRTPVTVTTGYYNTDGTFTATGQVWNFTGCWPQEVGNPTLDNASGDPATTTITIQFLEML